jgi:hypothetical protein
VKRWLLGTTLLLLSSWAWPQSPNDSLYQQLIDQYFTQNPGPYLAVDGLNAPWRPDSLDLDSAVQLRLSILSAEITYQPLPERRYLRQLLIPLQREDSLLRHESLTFSDTLSRRELRWVLRHSSLALRGEDPRRFSRWGRPALLLGGTALGTVLLFIARSRR